MRSLLQINFNNIETYVPDLEYGDNRKRFQRFEGTPPLRLFKSHQPYLPGDSEMVLGASEKGSFWWDKLPKCDEKIGGGMEETQCLCPNCPARWSAAVVVIRDARSTLCSYYNFQVALGNFEGGFGEFLRDREAGRYGYDYVQWLRSWLDSEEVRVVGASFPFGAIEGEAIEGETIVGEEEGLTSIYLIRYEDLKSDPVGTVTELVDKFLVPGAAEEAGFDEKVVRAVEQNDFDSMKRKETRDGGGLLFRKSYPDAVNGGFAILNKGRGKEDAKKECWVEEEDVRYLFEEMGWGGVEKKLGYAS